MKLFSKTFLAALVAMLAVAAIAHIIVYAVAPAIGGGDDVRILTQNSLVIDNQTSMEQLIGLTGPDEVPESESAKDYIAGVVRSALPYSAAASVLVSFVFALLLSRAVTNPIKRISAATGRMAALDRDARCDVTSCDEIGQLSQNVNRLYESLLSTIDSLQAEMARAGEAERAQLDFLRAASHELKTPVTALMAMLENMELGIGKYRDTAAYLPRCREMAAQLGDMVRDVLDASGAQLAVDAEETKPTDVAALLREQCIPYEMIAQAKGVRFELEMPKTYRLPMKAKHFARAVSNVLSNAVAYTEPGGEVHVRLADGQLIVDNSCKPIDESHLSHLFDPFYRPEFARDRHSGGNGLGLYLVAAMLSALGYAYAFFPLPDSTGMRFSIRFSTEKS